jgi:23S rRNA pseudouridine955/2504/2580 synthase
MIQIIANSNQADQRLDRLLRKEFPAESLGSLLAVLRKKKVRVNGTVQKAVYRVQVGDTICIYENLNQEQKPKPDFLNDKPVTGEQCAPVGFTVVHSCDAFLVCNKLAGVASQPGTGVGVGESLVEQVQYYMHHSKRSQWGGVGEFKPALAHRLDKDTSGLVLAALQAPALRKLTHMLKHRQMHKEYLTLVKGRLEPTTGTIELALERQDAPVGSKMKVSNEGLKSITHYTVVQPIGEYATLVRVQLETGRMHQIRTHFNHIGHPLAGDNRYGDFTWNRALKKHKLGRLFLHAHKLSFVWEGTPMQFSAPLPADLQTCLEALGEEIGNIVLE